MLRKNLILKVATLLALTAYCFTYPTCFNKPCELNIPPRGTHVEEAVDFLDQFDKTNCDINLNDLKEIAHLTLETNPSKDDITEIFFRLVIPKMSFNYLDLGDFIKDLEKEFKIPSSLNFSKLFQEALKKKECDAKGTIENFITRCKKGPKVGFWELRTLMDLFNTSIFNEMVSPVQFMQMIRFCKKDFLENGETNPQNKEKIQTQLVEFITVVKKIGLMVSGEHLIQEYLKFIYDPKNTPNSIARNNFMARVLRQSSDILKDGQVDRIFDKLEKLVVGQKEKESYAKLREMVKSKVQERKEQSAF